MNRRCVRGTREIDDAARWPPTGVWFTFLRVRTLARTAATRSRLRLGSARTEVGARVPQTERYRRVRGGCCSATLQRQLLMWCKPWRIKRAYNIVDCVPVCGLTNAGVVEPSGYGCAAALAAVTFTRVGPIPVTRVLPCGTGTCASVSNM